MDGNSDGFKCGLQQAKPAHGFASADFTQYEDPDWRIREAELRRWIELNYRWVMALVRQVRKRWPILGEEEFTAGDVTACVMRRLRNSTLSPACEPGSAELEARWRAYWKTVAMRLAMARAGRKLAEESRLAKPDTADGQDPLQTVVLDAERSEAALTQQRQFDLEYAHAIALKYLPVRQRVLYERIIQAARSGSASHRDIGMAIGVSHVTVGTVIATVRSAIEGEWRQSA
jgi:hypothetical protein